MEALSKYIQSLLLGLSATVLTILKGLISWGLTAIFEAVGMVFVYISSIFKKLMTLFRNKYWDV